jgi:hypothetical protein
MHGPDIYTAAVKGISQEQKTAARFHGFTRCPGRLTPLPGSKVAVAAEKRAGAADRMEKSILRFSAHGAMSPPREKVPVLPGEMPDHKISFAGKLFILSGLVEGAVFSAQAVCKCLVFH